MSDLQSRERELAQLQEEKTKISEKAQTREAEVQSLKNRIKVREGGVEDTGDFLVSLWGFVCRCWLFVSMSVFVCLPVRLFVVFVSCVFVCLIDRGALI